MAMTIPANWIQFFTKLAHKLPAETAHHLTINVLALLGRCPPLLTCLPPLNLTDEEKQILQQRLWGMEFQHPVGMAAGFDKDAKAVAALWGLGFAAVEVGSITPKPQAGNPKPRLFRLREDQAILNRMGFNSQGMAAAARRLAALRQHHPLHWQAVPRLGINLGKNKNSEAMTDYPEAAAHLAPFADYLVVNLSSPNTKGLRDLQKPEAMRDLIRATRHSLKEIDLQNIPLLVKLAPDFGKNELENLAGWLIQEVDGVILTNTTIARPPSLRSPLPSPSDGGLSGAPLAKMARVQLMVFNEINQGRIPIIACGGIANGQDAYGRILMGASLLQIYSAMIYKGPQLIGQMVKTLAMLAKQDGFAQISEAIGADPQRGLKLTETLTL